MAKSGLLIKRVTAMPIIIPKIIRYGNFVARIPVRNERNSDIFLFTSIIHSITRVYLKKWNFLKESLIVKNPSDYSWNPQS
jgi:hypothetical protein